MAFIDAVQINSVSRPFAGASRAASASGSGSRQERRRDSRQSVNISEETLLRIARQRLSRAVGSKLSYNRSGVFEPEARVGSLLDARA